MSMDTVATTNVILLVLAVASLAQTALLVALAVGAMRAYRDVTRLIAAEVTPSLLRLEGLLTNLEHTSALVRTRTDDVSRALDSARQTASQLGAVMWPRAAVVAGVAGGVLSAIRRWRAGRRTQPNVNVVAG
jgi:CRP-like cAMP-binding protein